MTPEGCANWSACVLRYVESATALRRVRLATAGATYVHVHGDAACADHPGDAPGGALPQWVVQAAQANDAPFNAVYLVDADRKALAAAEQQLQVAGTRVRAYLGQGEAAVRTVVSHLNKSALHFVVLEVPDPRALPFSTLKQLVQLPGIDLLIRVAVRDVQRHLSRYVASRSCPLDTFSPGWRDQLNGGTSVSTGRQRLYGHWTRLMREAGFSAVHGLEYMDGDKEQSPYWITYASRHAMADQFWENMRRFSAQSELPFG